MGACTQIHKLALLIKADFRLFGEIFNKLHLIGLVFLLEVSNRLFPRLCEAGNGQPLFYDFLHLCFNLCQILCGQRLLAVHIIVKSVCLRRSDGKLYLRVQTF